VLGAPDAGSQLELNGYPSTVPRNPPLGHRACHLVVLAWRVVSFDEGGGVGSVCLTFLLVSNLSPPHPN